MTRLASPPRRGRFRTLAALVAGASLAAMVACAARAPREATSQPPPGPDLTMSERPEQVRARIAELDDQIAGQLGQLDEGPPDADAVEAASAMTMAELHPTCVRSDRELCLDVCKLSDSICDNAAAICELAAELAGDAWADQKCASGKAACQRAGTRCCDC